jgi:hypothetical protein
MSKEKGKRNEDDRVAETHLGGVVPAMSTSQGDNMNGNEQPKVRLGEPPVVELPASIFARHVYVVGCTGPFKTARFSPELAKQLAGERPKRDDAAHRGQHEGQEGGES